MDSLESICGLTKIHDWLALLWSTDKKRERPSLPLSKQLCCELNLIELNFDTWHHSKRGISVWYSAHLLVFIKDVLIPYVLHHACVAQSNATKPHIVFLTVALNKSMRTWVSRAVSMSAVIKNEHTVPWIVRTLIFMRNCRTRESTSVPTRHVRVYTCTAPTHCIS